jgi:importin subunit alpha-1
MKRRLGRGAGGAEEDESAAPVDVAVLQNADASKRLVAQLNGESFDDVLSATVQIRKMLSIERDPPIDAVLGMHVLPRLVSFLQCWETQPQLALEAAWAITNVASGTSEHTRAVVEAGALPMFVQLLACAPEAVSF